MDEAAACLNISSNISLQLARRWQKAYIAQLRSLGEQSRSSPQIKTTKALLPSKAPNILSHKQGIDKSTTFADLIPSNVRSILLHFCRGCGFILAPMLQGVGWANGRFARNWRKGMDVTGGNVNTSDCGNI
jgi:hypothetical protein